MSWRPAYANFLHESYPRHYKCKYGDQGWLEEKRKELNPDIWQEEFPYKVISYKVHVQDKNKLRNPTFTNNPGTLDSSSIVCFHGKPLPHEALPKEKWMEEHWVE